MKEKLKLYTEEFLAKLTNEFKGKFFKVYNNDAFDVYYHAADQNKVPDPRIRREPAPRKLTLKIKEFVFEQDELLVRTITPYDTEYLFPFAFIADQEIFDTEAELDLYDECKD